MQVLTTTEEVSTKPGSGWAGILSPSLPDIYFAVVILWLFLGGGGKSLLSDGDTGWHIRTGDYILQHHAVPRVDIFTFTRPNAPWTFVLLSPSATTANSVSLPTVPAS